MTALILILIFTVLAIPLIIEAARLPMNNSERDGSRGEVADLPQGKTYYKWFGPKDGPVAVCVHGLTTPSFVWQGVATGLEKAGYRVLTYDLFGRGYSDRPIGKQNADFFLRQLDDLLRDQKVDGEVTLIGYSMGGAIASAFAARSPERVRQLVLLAPAGLLPVGNDMTRKMAGTKVFGLWLMLLLYPHILRKGLKAEADLPSSVPGLAKAQAAELDYRGFIPAVHSSLRHILSEDLSGTHQQLHDEGVPVLAIWGALDAVIPLAARDALTHWNADAVHHVIAGAGHGLTYTNTPEVLEKILEFLEMSS